MGIVTINIARDQGLTQALSSYAKSQNYDVSGMTRQNWNNTVAKLRELQARRQANKEESIYKGNRMTVQEGTKTFTDQEMDEIFESMGLKVQHSAGLQIPGGKEAPVSISPVDTPEINAPEISLPELEHASDVTSPKNPQEAEEIEIVREHTKTITTTTVEETVEQTTYDDPEEFKKAIKDLEAQGYKIEYDADGNAYIVDQEEVTDSDSRSNPDAMSEKAQPDKAFNASEEAEEVNIDGKPHQDTPVEVYPIKVDPATGQAVKDEEKAAEIEKTQTPQVQGKNTAQDANNFFTWMNKVKTDENYNEAFTYSDADTTEGQDQDLAAMADQFIARYDKDGDGQISYEEFREQYGQDKRQEMGEAGFGELLKKYQGYRDPEFKADYDLKRDAHHIFFNMDADNKNSKDVLTREEVMSTFLTMDANNKENEADGQVTRAEFQNFSQSLLHGTAMRDRIKAVYEENYKPAVNE